MLITKTKFTKVKLTYTRNTLIQFSRINTVLITLILMNIQSNWKELSLFKFLTPSHACEKSTLNQPSRYVNDD